jgi:hypothetical protein
MRTLDEHNSGKAKIDKEVLAQKTKEPSHVVDGLHHSRYGHFRFSLSFLLDVRGCF